MLPWQLPTDNSTRPPLSLAPTSLPRTRMEEPEAVRTPTNEPSGASLIVPNVAVPIWVVNWPAVMPGHVIGTFAEKLRRVRPLIVKVALAVPLPALPLYLPAVAGLAFPPLETRLVSSAEVTVWEPTTSD